MSTAMIWRAAPMRAPWMIDSPTPPQPHTATVCPARRPAPRNAAPTRRHMGADRLDDAGALVPEDDRAVEREPANPVNDVQIAVTHPGRDGAYQDLAAPRLVDIDRLDRQRLQHLAKHRGLDLHR